MSRPMVTRPIERRWAIMKSSRPDGERRRTERRGTAARGLPDCRTRRWLPGVLRRSQTARFHTLTLPETRQPRCHRAKPPLCSLAGHGTSGLVPGRQLALKPEGPFTPMDEPDRLAPAFGKSPISPLHPIHRKTVPLVLTQMPTRSDTLATTVHVVTTIPVVTHCSP